MKFEDKELTDAELENAAGTFKRALNCDPEVFAEKYSAYKKAKAEFEELYEPFKKNIIELHKESARLPKGVIIGGVKLTYVSPSVRNIIDSKRLKEEEPELAKKFTKTSTVSASVRLEDCGGV